MLQILGWWKVWKTPYTTTTPIFPQAWMNVSVGKCDKIWSPIWSNCYYNLLLPSCWAFFFLPLLAPFWGVGWGEFFFFGFYVLKCFHHVPMKFPKLFPKAFPIAPQFYLSHISVACAVGPSANTWMGSTEFSFQTQFLQFVWIPMQQSSLKKSISFTS